MENVLNAYGLGHVAEANRACLHAPPQGLANCQSWMTYFRCQPLNSWIDRLDQRHIDCFRRTLVQLDQLEGRVQQSVLNGVLNEQGGTLTDSLTAIQVLTQHELESVNRQLQQRTPTTPNLELREHWLLWNSLLYRIHALQQSNLFW